MAILLTRFVNIKLVRESTKYNGSSWEMYHKGVAVLDIMIVIGDAVAVSHFGMTKNVGDG